MGMKLFSDSVWGTVDANPDPNNYKIKEHFTLGNYLIVKINYPDATSFEGNKVLVFKDCSLYQLKKQKTIDPHFCNNKKYHSPIARFEPTKEGWRNAILFCGVATKRDGLKVLRKKVKKK